MLDPIRHQTPTLRAPSHERRDSGLSPKPNGVCIIYAAQLILTDLMNQGPNSPNHEAVTNTATVSDAKPDITSRSPLHAQPPRTANMHPVGIGLLTLHKARLCNNNRAPTTTACATSPCHIPQWVPDLIPGPSPPWGCAFHSPSFLAGCEFSFRGCTILLRRADDDCWPCTEYSYVHLAIEIETLNLWRDW